MWRRVMIGCVVGLVGVSAWAQTGSFGSVTGTVILGDTQHPARFATVQLQSLKAGSAGDQDDRFGGGRGYGGGMAGRTGLDGTFSITGVAPGDYFVVANVAGYVPERALLQAQLNAGAAAGDLVAQVPQVHVSAGGSGSVTVVLQRGGSLGGRLLWEDGSAAAGVSVQVISTVADVALPVPLGGLPGGNRSGPASIATTDDRGMFRLNGLPAGDYVLLVTIYPTVPVPFGGRGPLLPIRVYAPGVFHKANAKPITVRAGDDRDDVRMVLNLGSLRTVSGHVGSAVAGVSVLSGRVSMADSDGGVQLSGTIDASGDFAVSYAPPGTYTLTVQGSTTAASGFRGGRGRGGTTSTDSATFQPYTQTLIVGDTDVTGLGINLVQAKSQ